MSKSVQIGWDLMCTPVQIGWDLLSIPGKIRWDLMSGSLPGGYRGPFLGEFDGRGRGHVHGAAGQLIHDVPQQLVPLHARILLWTIQTNTVAILIKRLR